MRAVGKNNLKVGKNNLLNRAVFRILTAFIKNAYSEIYFNQIVREAGLNRSTIRAELTKLTDYNLLKKTRKGNADYYEITKEPRSTAILSYVEYCRTNSFLKENPTISNSLDLFKDLAAKTITCLIESILKGKLKT